MNNFYHKSIMIYNLKKLREFIVCNNNKNSTVPVFLILCHAWIVNNCTFFRGVIVVNTYIICHIITLQ